MWLILLAFGVCLAALGLAAGPRSLRREHFWWRVFAVLFIPLAALGIASAVTPIWRSDALAPLYLLAIPALILMPALLYRPSGPPPGSAGEEGGGPGPDPPRPPAPTRPRGGVPLPDAEQAPSRVRDHIRQRLRSRRSRRPAREPAREPVRIPSK